VMTTVGSVYLPSCSIIWFMQKPKVSAQR